VVNPGVWRISGTAGTNVSLLVTTIAQATADYTFVPNGCYVEFDGGTTADGDSCQTLTAGAAIIGTPLSIGAGDDDSAVAAIGTSSTAGDLLFTVGGVLDILNPLVAETPYVLSFQIDVTY
jgi:hypothetical protein